MGIEWLAIFSDGIKKILIEAIPAKISEKFSYRLELSIQLRNRPPIKKQDSVEGPIISIFVTIRNTGSKAEFLHRCGFDGSHGGGAAMSSMAEWKPPTSLESRSFIECELRFCQDHDPGIKSVWVENGLQHKWYLRKKELARLNEGLRSVLERNRDTLNELSAKTKPGSL